VPGALKKANRERLAFRDWWWGGSGQQTLSISGSGLVRTAMGSSGQGRYVASSLRMMNRFFHELDSSSEFSTVSPSPFRSESNGAVSARP